MLADLDLLLISVYCRCDDLLPRGKGNARRTLTDAEVVTLCVAQAIMGIRSDQRFIQTAGKRLAHLFPRLTKRSGFHKRRARLADSTPVECARSVETTRRSQLADAADYGYCTSHSRYFWGFRLHGLFALDGTPRALALTSPKTPERETCLALLQRVQRAGPLTLIGDKGYAGRQFAHDASKLDTLIARPARKDEPQTGLRLTPIRQRIESIFNTCKDLLTLERHGARSLHGLRARISQRFLTLAAAISLNHRLGRPARALSNYIA